MSGGFGAISGMIHAIKENRRLIMSKRDVHNDIKEKHTVASITRPLKYKNKMSKEEFETHRVKLIKEKRVTQLMFIGLIILIAVLTMGIAYLLKSF